MANRFSYEDFQKQLASSGLGGQFSQADLAMAQQNPDAGMSILKYKQDYNAATTDEARALANLGAEQVRSSWGGYTGGQTGGSFYLDLISPNDFSYGSAPTYTSSYAGTIQDLFNQQLTRGDYSYGGAKPTYTNRYDPTIQDLLNQIVNREDFSYNAETDPLYSQYRKQYTREGQRATADALGTAAAASGGIASSYAATAAGQAGDYYASKMTDKIPELYQLAYNQYMNDHSMKLSDLGAVQGAEQSDYQKYLNELSQYNTDRSFDYGVWSDAQQLKVQDLQSAMALEQMDYSKYLDQLNQYNTDRSFGYGQHLDEVGWQSQTRQEALDKAQLAAGYGDYSFLNGMGINTENNPAEWERQYNLAVLAAQYGDYSGLRALGVSPDANGLYQFNLAASGGLSRGSSGGLGTRSSGNSYSGSGTETTGSSGGIVDSMLSFNNDVQAYEFLVGQKYTSGVTQQLWDMYLDEKDKAAANKTAAALPALPAAPVGGSVGQSASQAAVSTLLGGGGTSAKSSSSGEAYNAILNSINSINPGTNANVPAVFADRIQKALSAGSITSAEADKLLSMLGY